MGAGINAQSLSLPDALEGDIDTRLRAWDVSNSTRRLFAGDPALWTNSDEARWIGWLGIVDDQLAHIKALNDVQHDVRTAGFNDAVVLGMGGSSLCPEVWAETFGKIAGSPRLHVLDSTDPAQIRSLEARLDLSSTLFIVSSKSGSTLEPNIFKAYFFDRVAHAIGAAEAPRRFIAITDPGSSLDREAAAQNFRQVFHGVPSIGGRYSALSNFGMVPAAVMGLDVRRLLDQAARMLRACASDLPSASNPAVVLGVVLGSAALRQIDKLTIVASPGIRDLGAWLEQLVAESTGKQGKGIIPVDREKVAASSTYGDDRLFAYLRLEDAPDSTQDAAVAELERTGWPVVTLHVATRYALAEEFIRWEIATAVAGALLGINPFDQPDVEASKIATRALTDEYEKTGALPPEAPFFERDGVSLFADSRNVEALTALAGPSPSIGAFLRAHLGRLGRGDYFALLAYLEMNAEHEAELQVIRHRVRELRQTATCLGFGPRFLHSTGQAYKGGPNRGVFLQLTCDDADDVQVPGQSFTFGIVKAAQARGDFQVLAERRRRALRVHLGRDVLGGLRTIATSFA